MTNEFKQTELFETQSPALVISASRRTDLVACHADYFIEKLKTYPPEKVHTLVIWTKNPQNMITAGKLKEVLSSYSQLYVHLTITGLGNTLLEPNIPEWKNTAKMLPDLIELVKGPERITWRFDPLIEVIKEGTKISNFALFPVIAKQIKEHGITKCKTSWVEPYKKVIRRLDKKDIKLEILLQNKRRKQSEELQKHAEKYGIELSYCSMEGLTRSNCIDGKLFNRLHSKGFLCSEKRAKGQRRLCGCTESIDIGWYSLKCNNGCLYCYAEPLI
jgi:hypothetical protein